MRGFWAALPLAVVQVSAFAQEIVPDVPVPALPAKTEVAREERNAATVIEGITVTATRVPTVAEDVPASIAVISGKELRARGVTDLRTALLLTAGASASGGGDAGPAGSTPLLRGSTETDDYLLVVDGVPLGGAFNPATAQVDFRNVERLEVLRGPSPVLYGAISFVGVVNISHYAAGQAEDTLQGFAGAHGGGGLSVAKALPDWHGAKQSLTVGGERTATTDPTAYADRLHGLYRAAIAAFGGEFRLDLDSSYLSQGPASPVLFDTGGRRLNAYDANFNPGDARLTDLRHQISLGFERLFDFGNVGVTLSAADNLSHHRRGFIAYDPADTASDSGSSGAVDPVETLTELFNETLRPALNTAAGVPAINGIAATGYLQRRHITDGYMDTHLTNQFGDRLTVVSGFDFLYGDVQQRTDAFDYVVAFDGSRPATAGAPSNGNYSSLGVTRRYAGLYSQAQWKFSPGWNLTLGLRANRTEESRSLVGQSYQAPEADDAFDSTRVQLGLAQGTLTSINGHDSRSSTRASGLVGINRALWRDAEGGDFLIGYASYRNTFKPADVDFGPSSKYQILSPQDGQSVELGVKGRGLEHALTWDADVYLARNSNVVIDDDATHSLVGAGEQVGGAELEARYLLLPYLSAFGDYTWTRANYRKLVLDGSDYHGKKLELVPEHEGALGLLYSRPNGPLASVSAKAFNSRYFDRDNTVKLGGYMTLDAALGWNAQHFRLQLSGQNLGNRRPITALTEFADSQYYVLPGRLWRVQLSAPF
jgi:iron complex outermembrane recepter protein